VSSRAVVSANNPRSRSCIACEPSPEGTTQTLQYQSTEETKVDLESTGAPDIIPMGSAQVTIDFSREGAFLFQAVNVRQMRIANRARVANAILKSYDKGKWRKEWFLVESLSTHSLERRSTS
jgi:hypothetical protein